MISKSSRAGRALLLCSSTVALLGSWHSVAHAQVNPPEKPASTTSGLDEIVVTAQRRDERLQDVPISVTAVSNEDARRLSIVEPKNLQFVTPGLAFPEDNGTVNPYIRGRGTSFSGPGLEGSVAIYIDDVYLQTQFGSGGLVDIAQLQVLKGPQGTLYGRNATGGAILINTANPTRNFEGYVEAGYGNLDSKHAEAVINIPAGDTLAFRFAGAFDKRDGFIRNVIDGEKNGRSERLQLRAKALWEPTDNFSALLKGEYQKYEADYLRNQVIDGTNTPTGLGFYETHRSPRVADRFGGENRVRIWSGTLKLSYEGDNFSVTNVTAYRNTELKTCSDIESIYAVNYDFCPQLPATGQAGGVSLIPNPLDPDGPKTVPAAYDRTWTNETRISSSFDGPFNFLVGANYQKTKARFSTVLTGETFGTLIPVAVNNLGIKNWAIYGEAYFQITPQLKLTAGGRFSKDMKTIDVFNNADAANAFGIPLEFFPASVHQRDNWKSFTPRIVLSYDAGSANFYASYSGGFKSGGFNAPSLFPQVPLRPEKIEGFEIGAKLRLMDNRLWLDMAAFHTKSKDIQVAAIDTSIGAVVQQNAATAKADGAEANLRFRADDNFTMQAGVAYLNSRFTSFQNASVFDEGFNPLFGQNLLIGVSEDLSGFPTALSPKWTLNGSATYEFPLSGGWGASVTLSARYSSTYHFQAGAGGPQRYDRQKEFVLVNLTGDITLPGDHLRLSWYVNNLFKQHYYDQLQTSAQTGSLPNGGGTYGVPALPRTYGIRARASF